MNVTILCPGPSLANYRPDGSRIVLGVNRAPVKYRCHVWVSTDHPLVLPEMDRVIGKPRLVTVAACKHELAAKGRPWRGRVDEVEGFLGILPPEYEWSLFSGTIALAYAARMGATHINVYGADWSGLSDFDGWAKAGNRSEARWQLERAIWCDRMVPWMRDEMGITVKRIGHE